MRGLRGDAPRPRLRLRSRFLTNLTPESGTIHTTAVDNESIISRPGEGAVKELRIEVRLKNNRLIRLREELGLRPKAMAEQIGTGYQMLLAFESLRRSPVRRSGEWTPSALKIARFHGVSPSYCWPDVVLGIEKPIAQVEVSADQAAALLGQDQLAALPAPSCDPEQKLMEAQLVDEMENAFENLSSREQRILAHHYGLGDATEQTMQDLASLGGCSRERIRQIEMRARAKLKDSIDPPEDSKRTTDLQRIQSYLRCIYAVPHLKGVKAQQAALKISPLVLNSGDDARHLARAFELELRREVDWCCMSPYCPTAWRTDREKHTNGFQCCVPCLGQLSGRDRDLLFRAEALDYFSFSGLRRWMQKANGRPAAGYCF